MSATNSLGTGFRDISRYFDAHLSEEFRFQKSSAGATGVTFLPLDRQFFWVVKWQNPSLSESEHLSTAFYKKAFQHLDVPTTLYPAPEELAIKTAKYFRGRKYVNIADNFVPMFMEYKHGNTLNKLIENGSIFKFPDEEFKKLFRMLGEVAAYDYLIANFDRFLPSDFEGTVNPNHSANGGNILIQFESDALHEERLVLKRVHVIDNAPLPTGFFTFEERREPSNEEDQIFDLQGVGWFGDGEDTEPQEKPTPNPASAADGETLRKDHHIKFVRFMDSDEQALKILAQQICIGIKNQWKEVLEKNRIQNHLFLEDQGIACLMEDNLFEGLRNAQEKMMSIDTTEVINYLKQMKKETKTRAGGIALEFIERNLMYIKNKK